MEDHRLARIQGGKAWLRPWRRKGLLSGWEQADLLLVGFSILGGGTSASHLSRDFLQMSRTFHFQCPVASQFGRKTKQNP